MARDGASPGPKALRPGGARPSRRVAEVRCQLCPRSCLIPPGHAGDCRVRINVEGRLVASTYGRPCALHIDPIEKKPLFHVLPGTRILSLATVGCNLHCRNCQNHGISQANPWDEAVRVQSLRQGSFGVMPSELVSLATSRGCQSIAATYTEPIVFYEYTRDTAELGRAAGLKMVTVTAGYCNPRPLRALCRLLHASNLDIKSMDPVAFAENSGGELRHVLRGAVIAKEEGVWLEITNLVIPTYNDSPQEMRKLCRFVVKELGAHTPLHFSRFFPNHRLRNLPPTPVPTLERAREIAKDEGLSYVYVGNLPGNEGESTLCPGCKGVIIRRVGHRVQGQWMRDGSCSHCGRPIEGVWQ
ncbi:MAG: AmmeMemoRadiSam system radical SAM enzyme [Polyangia bacterium]|nr:AmmeMemoRadiSam system radical SAM enzyme [Polyangia bacterium]